ncbi:hypothetical protein [Nocardia sp. NPDC052566]|uniref:hypothetical protein n=1 Tax=Nocardia sp. NPDC052566 TaxID=3364330 RepID=UPI0037C55BCB
MAAPATPLLTARALFILSLAVVVGVAGGYLGHLADQDLPIAAVTGIVSAGATITLALAVDWATMLSVRGGAILLGSAVAGLIVGTLIGAGTHNPAQGILYGAGVFSAMLVGLDKYTA